MHHLGDQSIEFSNFLSCQGVYTITLRTDNCLCNACHRDCLRSSGKPRWLGLSKHIICKRMRSLVAIVTLSQLFEL